jgi:hypothetical protein
MLPLGKCFSQEVTNLSKKEDSTERKLSTLKNVPPLPLYDSLVKNYKVDNIKRLDNAYLITLISTDNDKSLFTIISLKTNKGKGAKIRKGNSYDFLLYSYDNPNIRTIRGSPNLYKKVIVENTPVVFKIGFDTGIIVTTPNLKGLYYLTPVQITP